MTNKPFLRFISLISLVTLLNILIVFVIFKLDISPISNKYYTSSFPMPISSTFQTDQQTIIELPSNVSSFFIPEIHKLLFSLDANVSDKEMILTQNYSTICGQTLSLSEKETVCFGNIIEIAMESDEMVPNIIHYILLNMPNDIEFYHMVCMMSAFWINQPKLMILWHDIQPNGTHWNYLVKNFTSVSKQVILMPIQKPTSVYSHEMEYIQHYADVIRLELLYVFGGIYLDTDTIIVKSFQPLRKYSFTIGRESEYALCNGIMLSRRENPLIKSWHLFYRFYAKMPGWSTLSVLLANTLQIVLPEHFHVEEESICRPNWGGKELSWLFDTNRNWNWKEKNYAIHLWFKFTKKRPSWDNVLTEDSMMGDIFRWILYGNTNY